MSELLRVLQTLDRDSAEKIYKNWLDSGLLMNLEGVDARKLSIIYEKSIIYLMNHVSKFHIDGGILQVETFILPCLYRIFVGNDFKNFPIIPVIKNLFKFIATYQNIYFNNKLHSNRHGKKRDIEAAFCYNFCKMYVENLNPDSPNIILDFISFY